MIRNFKKLTALFTVVCLIMGLLLLSSTVPVKAQVSGFVTRTGDKLMLGGSEFRYVGCNSYYLNLDENPYLHLSTAYEVTDALKTAKEMGFTVVRTFGITVGSSLTLEPTLGTWNETAWRQLDYVIKTAGENDIRLILPFIDNYAYYHGGKKTFTDWRGVAESQFYTDTTVINDYKQLISQVLNRVNYYTGVAYKNDPAILCWETGNELSPPDSWTPIISAYIKSIDTNHLVMDGQWLGGASESLTDPNVDIVSNHLYGNGNYSADCTWARDFSKGYKPLVLGEFGDWTSWRSINVHGLLDNVISNGTTGVMIWSIFGHDDLGGFIQHADSYTLHYPGDNEEMIQINSLLRDHAYQIRNMSVPTRTAPLAPTALSNVSGVNGLYISWKGSVGADSYNVKRATSAGGPWTTIATGVKENDLMYTGYADTTASMGTNYYYKMSSTNTTGTSGDSSVLGPVQRVSVQNIVDDLNDASKVYSYTSNLTFDSSSPSGFGGDTCRVTRTASTYENIVYRVTDTNMVGFRIHTYFWPSETVQDFRVYTSSDGTNYYESAGTIDYYGGDWKHVDYVNEQIPVDTKYLKIEFRNTSTNYWNPQISKVEIFAPGGASKQNLMNVNGTLEQTHGIMWIMGPHFSYSTQDKVSNLYSMKLDGAGDWCNAYYDINVKPNTQYQLKFYAKSSQATVYKVWGLDTNTSLTGDQYTTGNNTWTQYSVSFNSDSNYKARVYVCDGGGTHYFDNFELR